MASTYLKTESVAGVLIATPLTEKIAERECNVLLKEISEEAAKHGWKVATDLTEVMLLASVGLGMFVTLNRDCKKNGGKLVVFGLSPELMSLLQITRLEKVFGIAKDRDAALKLLA